jgi:hypothetical protein
VRDGCGVSIAFRSYVVTVSLVYVCMDSLKGLCAESSIVFISVGVFLRHSDFGILPMKFSNLSLLVAIGFQETRFCKDSIRDGIQRDYVCIYLIRGS